MPSATHIESPTLTSGKKRRREGDHGEVQRPLIYASPQHPVPLHQHLDATINNAYHQHGDFPNSLLGIQRKIRPLNAKRARTIDNLSSQDVNLSEKLSTHHSHQNNFNRTTSPSAQTRPTAGDRTTSSSAILSPCHICHRKPTKRSDLDCFADCEGCEQRTCYVCIRECLGWVTARNGPPLLRQIETQERPGQGDGRPEQGRGRRSEDDQEDDHHHQQQQHPDHGDEDDRDEDENMERSFTMHDVDDAVQHTAGEQRAPGRGIGAGGGGDDDGEGWNAPGHCTMICSRCCIERGSEGDVVCLGCLAGMEAA